MSAKKVRPHWDLRDEITAAADQMDGLTGTLKRIIRLREEIEERIYNAEIRALAPEFNVLFQRMKSLAGKK